MSKPKRVMAASLCVLSLGLTSSDADNATEAQGGTQAVQVTVEVLEFDCLNATTDLVKCNSVMRAARTSVPDTSVLSAVAPEVRKVEYSGLLYPDQLLRGKASEGDTRLEVKLDTGVPVDGRYQVELRAKYIREGNRLTSLNSSLLMIPGEGPARASGGMTERAVKIKGKERRVSRYELVQLRLETP